MIIIKILQENVLKVWHEMKSKTILKDFHKILKLKLVIKIIQKVIFNLPSPNTKIKILQLIKPLCLKDNKNHNKINHYQKVINL